MRDNADVIRESRLQIFKLPFVVCVACFPEAILWFLDRDVFGLRVQDVDFDFPFANWPFPSRRRRERIRKSCVTYMQVI